MKKFKLLSLLMVMFAMASCSDNDDEAVNLAADAAGEYPGYTVASSAYFSNMVAPGQKVDISSSDINKVNISYVSDTWGTISIDGAVLSGTAGDMRIVGSGKSVMAHAGNAAKEYDCSVEGSLAGKNLSLAFSCPAVMGGLKIEFFQGDIPADIVVPGTYSGYTEAKSAYFSGMMADDQKVVITKNADESYSVAYSSDTWGDFSIDNVVATFADGKFSLKGNGVSKMGMNGDIKEYDCSFEGSVDPAKESPTFTFAMPAVMGGLSIVFHSGDMPAAE